MQKLTWQQVNTWRLFETVPQVLSATPLTREALADETVAERLAYYQQFAAKATVGY